jgi:hypothetical protein
VQVALNGGPFDADADAPYNPGVGLPHARTLLQQRAASKAEPGAAAAAAAQHPSVAALLAGVDATHADAAGVLAEQLQRLALLADALAELGSSQSYLQSGIVFDASDDQMARLDAALRTLHQVCVGGRGCGCVLSGVRARVRGSLTTGQPAPCVLPTLTRPCTHSSPAGGLCVRGW